jgi:GAF domain-containing protein
MIKVDHSAFVWFRETLDYGDVVAQFPTEGFEELRGREVQLADIDFEQRLINEEVDAIEILDVDDLDERRKLGPVAVLLDQYHIKSLYIVKVKIHGEVIGSFSLDRTEAPNCFSDEEKSLCHELARLASSTIENALWSDWLQIFQDATKAIISQQEISKLLETIVTRAAELLSVDEAGIYERLYDGTDEYLQLSACSLPETVKIIRRINGGMAWQLIDGQDHGQGYLESTDYQNYPFAAEQFKETGRFGSVLEVPMTWLGERIGVLFVAGKKGRKFTRFSADRLQRIADIATLAIQRCRLLDRIEDISNANVEFAKGLESDSLKSQLTVIAQYATQILGAEMCGIFRVRDSTRMTLEAGFGHQPDRFPVGQPFRIEDKPKTGLTGAIAYRLRQQYLQFIKGGSHEQFKGLLNLRGDELTLDPAVKGGIDNSPSGKCYSLLAVPLVSLPPDRTAMTGLLRISNKKGVGGVASPNVQFTQEDEWILRIFAEAAALAIEKAEIFSERKAQLDLYQIFSEVLTEEAELDSRLDSIAKQLAVVLKKSYCRILFSQDNSAGDWKVRAAGLHPKNVAVPNWDPGKGSTVATDQQPFASMLQESSPQVLWDGELAKSSLFKLSQSLQIGDLKSAVAIPLKVRTATGGATPHIVGALEFGELRDPERGRGVFHPKEIEKVSHAALLTAELLKRDAIRNREQELDAAYHDALARIRKAEPVDELLLAIRKEALKLFKYERSLVLVQRPNGAVRVVGDPDLTNRISGGGEENYALFERAFADETTIDAPSMRQLCKRIGLQPATMLVTRLYDGTDFRYGLVLTQSRPPVFESEVQKRVLLNLSRQCTISLTKAVINERLHLTRHAIDLFGQTLAQGKPEEALKNALEAIREALECDSVILYEIDSRSREYLGPQYVGNVGKGNVAPAGKELAHTAVGRILRRGDLHVASDAATDEIMSDDFQRKEGIESSAGMPISIKLDGEDQESRRDSLPRERTLDVGVLFVNYKQRRDISKDDQRIFRSFAPYVALAIKNQELYEKERKKRKIQEALLAAAKSLSESLEAARIEDRIAIEANNIAKAAGRKINSVVVKLIAENSTRIVSAYPVTEARRLRHELITLKSEIPLVDETGKPYGIVGRAVRNKKTETVNEVGIDKDYVAVNPDTESQMVVLLPPAEHPVGVISIESRVPNTFYEEDEETFDLFAALAADAIRNAQQYDTLSEVTAMAMDDIWTSIFTHDYDEATDDIIRAANLLLNDIDNGASVDRLQQLAESVVRRGQDLRDLIPRKIAYESFPKIKLDRELRRWCDNRRAGLESNGIRLRYLPAASDLRVRIHARLLDYVLEALLKNAVPLLKADIREVTLKAVNSAEGVEIVLANTGPAISDSMWDNLGIRRVESTTGGKGRGLLIASQIIKFCQGEFLKVSNKDGEVALGMRLPEVKQDLPE